MTKDMFDIDRAEGRNRRELEYAQKHLEMTDPDMIPDALESLFHACKILLQVAIATYPPDGVIEIANALSPKARTALCYSMGMGGVYRDSSAHKLFRVGERLAIWLSDEGLVTVKGTREFNYYQGFMLTPLGRQVANYILFTLSEDESGT